MSNPNYLIDTSEVPEGVEPHLAHNRNLIIERYRQGSTSAEVALHALSSLYWYHQDTASDETRFYLTDVASEFPLEAGMDQDEAFTIWQNGRPD